MGIWVKGQNIVWVSDEHVAESPKLGGVIAAPHLQDDLPDLFVDYRKDCVPDGPPAGAAVVCFPRSPKPHEVADVPWVKRHWC